MKILLATDSFPPVCGGSGWSTYELARGLRTLGHSIVIVQPRPGSRGVHEKMSMLIVPVSGHVCSTACESRRISTQTISARLPDVAVGTPPRKGPDPRVSVLDVRASSRR